MNSDDRFTYSTSGSHLPRRRGPLAFACSCLTSVLGVVVGLLSLVPFLYFGMGGEGDHEDYEVHGTPLPIPIAVPPPPSALTLADLPGSFGTYAELDPSVFGDLAAFDVVAGLPRIYEVVHKVEPDAVLTFAKMDKVDRNGRLDAVGDDAQFLFVSAAAAKRTPDQPGLFVHLTGGKASLTRTTSATEPSEAAPSSPLPCPLPNAYAAAKNLSPDGPYEVGINWNGTKKRWAWAITDPRSDARVPWVWADDCKSQ